MGAIVVDPNRQFVKPIPSTNLPKGQIALASVVQVAFIMADGTHAVYDKTLSHALG